MSLLWSILRVRIFVQDLDVCCVQAWCWRLISFVDNIHNDMLSSKIGI